jgi:hypothetical protein
MSDWSPSVRFGAGIEGSGQERVTESGLAGGKDPEPGTKVLFATRIGMGPMVFKSLIVSGFQVSNGL